MPIDDSETAATNGKLHNGMNGAGHMNDGQEE